MEIAYPRDNAQRPSWSHPTRRLAHGLSLAFAAAVILAGCAPGVQTPAGQSVPGAPSIAGAPAPPKILQIGLTSPAEPRAGGIVYGGGGAGGPEPQFALHAGLTKYSDQGVIQPWIAERVPTFENGDWTLGLDGTMTVTWKLRPNIRWHDGTHLTADDVILGYKVGVDPEMFNVGTKVLNQITDISAPDAQTLVFHWKNPYIYANSLGLRDLVPLPTQRFGALYAAGDKQALTNSPSWGEDWIGVGGYKMQQWLRGSFIDVVANDDYFLGRPKIDRLVFHYYGDVNALILTTVAGDIDTIPVGTLKDDEASVLKDQWKTPGAGTVLLNPSKLRYGQWQFRDPSAVFLQDPRIRQGLTRLVDRQGIVDTIQHGLSTPSDIPLLKSSPVYPMAQQRGLPALSYDPTEGHRLLSDAGLRRGGDGIYRTVSGVPLAFEMNTSNDIASNIAEMLAIANGWQTNGAQPNQEIVTAKDNKDQIRSTTGQLNLTSTELSYTWFDSWATSQISSEATKWKGGNPIGYSAPAYDSLYGRLYTTLASADRDQVAADLIKYTLDQELYLPLAYSDDVSAYRKGITGMTGVFVGERVTGWNYETWDMQ